MARQVATTAPLKFTAGNVAETFTWGTVAVLIKRDAVAGPAWMCPLYSGQGGASNWGASIDLNTGNTCWYSIGSGGSHEVVDSKALNSTSVWYLIIVTKAPGSAAPVFHYRTQTAGVWGSWEHNVGGSAIANGADVAVSQIWLGSFAGFDEFAGVYAAAGIYHGWAPNNAAVEAAAFDVSGQKWVDAVPSATLGAWVVVPGSTATGSPIQDLGGGGGHETTTGVGTVVAGPTSWSETIGGGGTAHQVTITDPLGAVDTLARVAVQRRTISDVLGLVDSLSVVTPTTCTDPLLDHLGNPILDSDGNPICGTGGGATNWTRTITSPLGLTDTLTRTAAALRTLTDPLGATDTLTRAAAARRTFTDPLGLLDSVNRVTAARRSVVDPLGATDTLARQTAQRRTISDVAGLADQLNRTAAAARSIADPLGIVDSLEARRVLLVVLTDALGLTDQLDRRAVYGRSIVDGVAGSDSIGGEQAAARQLVDPLDLDDTLTRLAVHGRTIVDALGATDSRTWVHHQRRTIVDLLGMIDTISVQLASPGTFSLSDPLGLTDALLRVVSARRAQVDSLALSDVLSAAVRRVREIVDAVSIVDVLERAAASSRELTDPLTLTDSLVAQITSTLIQRTLVDPLTLTDTLLAVQQVRRTLIDELTLTDTIDVADAVRLYAAAAGLVLRAWRAGALQRSVRGSAPIRQYLTRSR